MILIILRLVTLAQASKETDRTFDMTIPAILTQLEMHFAVLAATIPILRNPLTKLNTGYLNTTLEQMDPTANVAFASKASSSGKGQSYILSNMTASRRRDSRVGDLRMGPMTRTIAAAGGSESPEERESIISEGSDRIIVQRSVKIDYA